MKYLAFLILFQSQFVFADVRCRNLFQTPTRVVSIATYWNILQISGLTVDQNKMDMTRGCSVSCIVMASQVARMLSHAPAIEDPIAYANNLARNIEKQSGYGDAGTDTTSQINNLVKEISAVNPYAIMSAKYLAMENTGPVLEPNLPRMALPVSVLTLSDIIPRHSEILIVNFLRMDANNVITGAHSSIIKSEEGGVLSVLDPLAPTINFQLVADGTATVFGAQSVVLKYAGQYQFAGVAKVVPYSFFSIQIP